jgi:adenine-specific DNA-methyltransferase
MIYSGRIIEVNKLSEQNFELTEESINYIENTDIEYRKKLGQYFTPKTVREALISKLPKMSNPKILDPSCGSGEFLLSCADYFDSPSLNGIEIDENLVNIAKTKVKGKIICKDALKIESQPIYDVVIGNPPYFEFKPYKSIKNKFRDILNGRANIFSMFVKLGLDFLKDGGYLAYVIPPSMNNGAYFNKLRKYIHQTANIEYLTILSNEKIFHKAQQSVMLLILRKGKSTQDYIFERNGIMLFSEEYNQLRKLYEETFSLRDLGYRVKTGTIVWNQHKDKLTNDPNGAIVLLWSHNIQNNKLVVPFNEDKKPQYIRYPVYDNGPAVVVNRVTGTVSKTRLKSAIVPVGMKYLGENHINIIYKDSSSSDGNLFKVNDMPKMSIEQIHKALSSEESIQTIMKISGNTQLSKTELEMLFPIKPV